MQKSHVQNALRRLHEFLRVRGADLRVIYLPFGPGGTKTGVDDFIAAGRPWTICWLWRPMSCVEWLRKKIRRA
jgi:hypothetical protein